MCDIDARKLDTARMSMYNRRKERWVICTSSSVGVVPYLIAVEMSFTSTSAVKRSQVHS